MTTTQRISQAPDRHFHRSQQLLAGNTLSRQPVSQKAAAPIFYEIAPGEGAMYDIPAYMRRRIEKFDYDNKCRVMAYVDRVRMMIRSAAA
jgi:hypothetical protein